MSQTPARRLLRAAGMGLSLGLGAAGCALLGRAFFHVQVDCSGMSLAECQLAHESGRTVARLEGLGSLGLLLVSFGTWIFVKRSTPPRTPSPTS